MFIYGISTLFFKKMPLKILFISGAKNPVFQHNNSVAVSSEILFTLHAEYKPPPDQIYVNNSSKFY